MDAASISANRLAEVQAQASLLVLRKALDLQATTAQQLIQVLPTADPIASSTLASAGHIDTWA